MVYKIIFPQCHYPAQGESNSGSGDKNGYNRVLNTCLNSFGDESEKKPFLCRGRQAVVFSDDNTILYLLTFVHFSLQERWTAQYRQQPNAIVKFYKTWKAMKPSVTQVRKECFCQENMACWYNKRDKGLQMKLLLVYICIEPRN